MAPKGGFELKTPKGTRDWDGKHMVLREQIFDTSKRPTCGVAFEETSVFHAQLAPLGLRVR